MRGNVGIIGAVMSVLAVAGTAGAGADTTLPPVTLPPTTLPSTTLPPVTLPPPTLPSTTLPPVTLPSTTLPQITLPATTLPVLTTTTSTSTPATTATTSGSRQRTGGGPTGGSSTGARAGSMGTTGPVDSRSAQSSTSSSVPSGGHASEGVLARVDDVADAALDVLPTFWPLFGLMAAVMWLLARQAEFDRRDPRLVDAPIDSLSDTRGFA